MMVVLMCTGWGSWSDARSKQSKDHPPAKVSRKERRRKHTINEQQDKKFVKHMVCTVRVCVCVYCSILTGLGSTCMYQAQLLWK